MGPAARSVARRPAVIARIPGAFNITRSGCQNFLRGAVAMKQNQRDAKAAILGDSATWGYQSEGVLVFTNNRIDSPPYQLATKLAAGGVPSVCENFFGLGDLGAVTFANFLTAEPRITRSGTSWAGSSIQGPGWSVMQNTTSTVDTFTFTTNSAVDTMDISYVRASGVSGQLVYKIDGGADSTAINMSTGTPDQQVTVTGKALGSVATHALQFRLTATNGYIAGLNFYDSTKRQVQIWQWGVCSARPNDWLKTPPNNAWDIRNNLFRYSPDLVIINCVENPLGDTPLPATVMDDIQTMITGFRLNGTDVWLVMPQPINDEQVFQPAYKKALYDLAILNGCPFIDLQAANVAPWSTPTANLTAWKAASFWTDDKHPNTAGYGENARRYQEVVSAVYAAA